MCGNAELEGQSQALGRRSGLYTAGSATPGQNGHKLAKWTKDQLKGQLVVKGGQSRQRRTGVQDGRSRPRPVQPLGGPAHAARQGRAERLSR